MSIRPVGVWLSCSLLVLACAAAAAADEPAKVPEVPFARPVVREVADHEDFTGRTEASLRVDVRPRVTGYLLKAPFEEGAEVREGDLLFEIDPRPYQARLDQATAAARVAEAQLKQADAALQRAKALQAQKVISPEEVDKAFSERVVAEARLRAAQAGLDLHKLNLDFTRVRAPIAGRVGRRLLDPGNLAKADDTTLATVVSRDPMYLYFDVDERTVLRLRRPVREGGDKAGEVSVAVGLAGEEGHPHRGRVNFTDNQVNPETGTLRMRAVLPNKDGLLMPGLFARVRLPIGRPYKALLVPAEAVLADEGARYVYVVGDSNVIERRRVEVGPDHDGLRIVREGLKAEDRVVVGRQQRLRPGMTVRPAEAGRPAPKPAAPAKPGAVLRPVRGEPGPVLVVEAAYPAANAAVVADTIAAPIEEQVKGVEKALFLRSRSTDDGKYVLAVTFARGADPDVSQVLVQNRASLAAPVLPELVQRTGVTVRKRMPGALLIVTLLSPGGRYDEVYLANYARIQVKDELARLAGVADVTLVGPGEYGLRVWLDPEKLAAHKLTAAEVARALEEQNLPAGADRIGEAPKGRQADSPLELKPTGRLLDPEQLAEVVLKAEPGGRVVRLRDVANIELGAAVRSGGALLDGKPAVALAVHALPGARPRKVSEAVRQKVADLRQRTPDGLDLAVPFDFTANVEAPERADTPEYLLLDPDFPSAASAERVRRLLGRGEALLRPVDGVRHTLALGENPFDLFGSGPCVLVALGPAEKRKASRGEIERAVRGRLDEIKEMSLRVRDLSGPGRFPRCAYPIDLAVRGPDAGPVRDFATKLARRLGERKELADVAVNADCLPRPSVTVDIDRRQAADRGVSVQDVFNTLQLHAGSLYVNDFNRFGRTWRVELQVKPGSGDWADDVKRLRVRNARGQMVPLGALVTVRQTTGPRAIDRFDGEPMVEVMANPAPGTSVDAARALCEKLAAEVRAELQLSAEYGFSWLR